MTRKRMIITTILVLLAVALVIAGVAVGVSSCSYAPPIEELRDDVIALLEASGTINNLYFGTGLPVLSRSDPANDDFYAHEIPESMSSYEVVDLSNSRFLTINSMKAATLLVYSEACANPVFDAAFDGVYSDLLPDKTLISKPFFLEQDGYLYQLCPNQRVNYDSIHRDGRDIAFDYSTLQVEKPSTATNVYLSVTAYNRADPTTTEQIRFSITLSTSGWRLNKLVV